MEKTSIGTAQVEPERPYDEMVSITVYFKRGEGGTHATISRHDHLAGSINGAHGKPLYNAMPLEEAIQAFRDIIKGERSESNRSNHKRAAGAYGGNVGS